MDSLQISSSPFLSLSFFVFFLLIKIPPSLCNYDLYKSCSNRFTCGLIQADYPFWGNSRPANCGHPDLKLDCQKDTATISIMNVTYRVLDINPDRQVIKLARDDYMRDICLKQFQSTTLDYALFDYGARYQNLTLLYGCAPFNASIPRKFKCPIGGIDYDGYIEMGTPGPGLCKFSVVVPIDPVINVVDTGSLSKAIREGFEVRWKVRSAEDCRECINSARVCGFSRNSNQTICFCQNQPSESTSCNSTPTAGVETPTAAPGAAAMGIQVVLPCIFFLILLPGIVFICFRCKLSSSTSMKFWKKRSKNDQNLEDFIRNHGSLGLKRYTSSSIKKITNSFTDKLGQGGYGGVYKGKLPDGKLVAVKVLNASKGNGEEFINEVASICRTSHVNIVTLLGFCLEPHKRAVIYEFMPNGSLEKFLWKDNSLKPGSHLGWKKLYQIAIGIARGLEYLHRGCNTRILHFDIKPHNILLDKDFCPKISDFGMAKLCPGRESIVSMMEARGTIGYIAPEVFSRNFGGVSHKSDVYSYGMMVLEMVGATEKINFGASHSSEMYFPQWVYKHLELNEEIGLQGIMCKEESDSVRKMILVGLWCIQTIPSNRPSVSKVIEMLGGSLEDLQIPPKPFLCSPPRLPQEISATSSSTS